MSWSEIVLFACLSLALAAIGVAFVLLGVHALNYLGREAIDSRLHVRAGNNAGIIPAPAGPARRWATAADG